MAAGLLALLDDISVLMDDVATMSKVATKKTAGILGDDLAVNAEKASGFASSRELPILWQITKGSFINKLIILPVAFLLSAFAPWLIVPILMVGGVYLAYEGVEKIYEFFFHRGEKKHVESLEKKSKEEVLSEEKEKIKSAIITDFILSIEIIIIALSTVADQSITVQIGAVSFVALEPISSLVFFISTSKSSSSTSKYLDITFKISFFMLCIISPDAEVPALS